MRARTELVSYDRLERLLGQEPESTNRRDLEAIKTILPMAIARELTGRQRECVELYFYERLTEEEVGARLGVSKSTVCRHLQKAKARLAKALSYAAAARKTLSDDEAEGL